MRIENSNKRPAPRLHRDGTVSFWSYYRQDWVEHVFYVPVEELEAMPGRERGRVSRHLGYEEEAPAEAV